MRRASLALLCLLLNACQRSPVGQDAASAPTGGAASRLERAAIESGAIADPAKVSPVGLFQRSHEAGRDALCVVPGPDGALRFGLEAVFGAAPPSGAVPGDYDLVECTACGLVYADPMLAGGGALYDWLTSFPKYHAQGRWEWAKLKELLVAEGRPVRLLELGAGQGDFLPRMSRGRRYASCVSDLSESEQIARAAAGDRMAQSALVNRHMPVVWRVAFRMLGDRQEAEDVTQETFLRAWKMLPDWEARARTPRPAFPARAQ